MNPEWIEVKFGAYLIEREITPEQQHLKMQRLSALGAVRIHTSDGAWYEVEGSKRLYNPILGVWRSRAKQKERMS